MMRFAYLLSLLVLQLSLVLDVVPMLGESLRVGADFAQARDADAALMRLAITGVGIIGGGFALAAPLFALLRHRQRGALRFLGLPGWAVMPAIAGAVVYAACAMVATWLIDVDLPWLDPLQDIERQVALAAISLMAGGVLAAELLRRSVAPPRLLRDLMPRRPGRTEVVGPDELRTHAR